jgi:DNA-binding transcriptional MocR family regulator
MKTIVEALAADVASGRLHRGERLPTHRALAKALGVDLTTVTRAYNEARAPRADRGAGRAGHLRRRKRVARRARPRPGSSSTCR